MLATAADTLSPSSSSQPHLVQSNSSGSAVLTDPDKIRHDLRFLFTSIKKNATQFALAVKPDSPSQPSALDIGSGSALEGLCSSSLQAAAHQLKEITDDHLPKLLYLVQKARIEADVYQPLSTSSDEREDQKKRAEIEALAKSLGGMIRTGAELGLSSPQQQQQQLRRIGGLGRLWSNQMTKEMLGVISSLLQVCDATMDEKTRSVMMRARKVAEERERGIRSSDSAAASIATTQQQAISGADKTKLAKELREKVLQATKMVWERCDDAEKKVGRQELEILIAKMALQKEFAKDAIEELEQGIRDARKAFGEVDEKDLEAKEEEQPGEEDGYEEEEYDYDDEDDEYDLGNDAEMNVATLELAKQILPILRTGITFHSKLDSILSSSTISNTDAAESGSTTSASTLPPFLRKIDWAPIDEALDQASSEIDVVVTQLLHMPGTIDPYDVGDDQLQKYADLDPDGWFDQEMEGITFDTHAALARYVAATLRAFDKVEEVAKAMGTGKKKTAASMNTLAAGAGASSSPLAAEVEALREHTVELKRAFLALPKGNDEEALQSLFKRLQIQ